MSENTMPPGDDCGCGLTHSRLPEHEDPLMHAQYSGGHMMPPTRAYRRMTNDQLVREQARRDAMAWRLTLLIFIVMGVLVALLGSCTPFPPRLQSACMEHGYVWDDSLAAAGRWCKANDPTNERFDIVQPKTYRCLDEKGRLGWMMTFYPECLQ